MTPLHNRIIVLFAAAALSGCSFASDALFPSLGGDEATETEAVAIQPAAVEASTAPVVAEAPPAMGETVFEPVDVSVGEQTGTFVGQKVVTLRRELKQLQLTIRQRNADLQNIRNKAAEDARQYHELIAYINARLQVGTTPGNPRLQARWVTAQNLLKQMNENVVLMNQLATQVATDSAMTSYLLSSIRSAYNVPGAVDEDHHQLRILEDETGQTSVLIERLLVELNHDISRQQQYISNEKDNLNRLAGAIKEGQLYSAPTAFNAGFSSAAQQAYSAPSYGPSLSSGDILPQAATKGRRPLVRIRFNRPNPRYETLLYQAVQRALESQPSAGFELVAVTPASKPAKAGESRRNAEKVLRSLSGMNLPPERVSLSSSTDSDVNFSEVRLYLR